MMLPFWGRQGCFDFELLEVQLPAGTLLMIHNIPYMSG